MIKQRELWLDHTSFSSGLEPFVLPAGYLGNAFNAVGAASCWILPIGAPTDTYLSTSSIRLSGLSGAQTNYPGQWTAGNITGFEIIYSAKTVVGGLGTETFHLGVHIIVVPIGGVIPPFAYNMYAVALPAPYTNGALQTTGVIPVVVATVPGDRIFIGIARAALTSPTDTHPGDFCFHDMTLYRD